MVWDLEAFNAWGTCVALMIIHYYKMWVQFTSPRSLDQGIQYFFTNPRALQLVNSLKIH
jgi:hypothetical protein